MRKRLRKKLAKPWLEIAERYASAPASFWITAPMRAHDMFFEAMIRCDWTSPKVMQTLDEWLERTYTTEFMTGWTNPKMTPLWAQWLEEIDMTPKTVMVQKGGSVGFTMAAITGGKLKCFAAGDTPVGIDDEGNVVAMDEVVDE